MPITIDAAGRIVIPKAVREAAGIRPGMPLEARFHDGRIEIEPAPAKVEIVDRGGVSVAVYDEGTPILRAEDVSTTLDDLRKERG